MGCSWLTQNTLKTEKVTYWFTVPLVFCLFVCVACNVYFFFKQWIIITKTVYYICITLSLSTLCPFTSVRDPDVCLPLWPWRSGRAGPVFPKGSLHCQLPSISLSARGAQTAQSPTRETAQEAGPERVPLQLHGDSLLLLCLSLTHWSSCHV